MDQRSWFILSPQSSIGLYLRGGEFHNLRARITRFNRLRYTSLQNGKRSTDDEVRSHLAKRSFDLSEDPGEEAINLYLGRDGESFYLDAATRDIQGVLADNRVCEIDASNVRG